MGTNKAAMQERVAYLNGEFVAESAAKLSVFDAGVMAGEMAFEATRTFAGRPFELPAHLNRLRSTLDFLKIDAGVSTEELIRLTDDLLDRNRPTQPAEFDWLIMHGVSSGVPTEYGGNNRPTVLITCVPLIQRLARVADFYDQGVKLVVPPQRSLPADFLDPRAKTRSRVHLGIAARQASEIDPAAWALLLDERGCLAEGTFWNVFVVRDGELLTPRERNVLPGISRTVTMKLAVKAGISAREADIPLEDALSADEVLCTATSFCVLPATHLNGDPIGNGKPGEVCQILAQAWRELVRMDYVAQARSMAYRTESLDSYN